MAARVRAAFAHAWAGYESHAFGDDELKPVSNRTSIRWGNLGISLLDSLDTMLLLGLEHEYQRARHWVIEVLPERISNGGDVPFFEITIRGLGGLLGAHALRPDSELLKVALKLGSALLPALTSSPSGIPFCSVHLQLGAASCPDTDLGQSIPLAELGSIQLEFSALAHAVGNPSLAEPSERALRVLRRLPPLHGLFPTRMRPLRGGPASKEVSFGSGSDSFYETLLKRWLQSGQGSEHRWLRTMYRDSLHGLRRLLRRSHPSRLLFIAKANGGEVGSVPRSHALREAHQFEHLSCFVPGMLALGAHHNAGHNATWEMETARELLDTCTQLYDRHPSGLGPERISFVTGGQVRAAEAEAAAAGRYTRVLTTDDYDVIDPHWHLRPEYVESLYVLWRLEGRRWSYGASDDAAADAAADARRADYRQRGLRVLDAIETHCRTPSGYSGTRDGGRRHADGVRVLLTDRMESFFLAETLKYLFLLLSETHDTPIDLDRMIFTTEAHALPVHTPSGGGTSEAESCVEGEDATDAAEEGEQLPTFPPWWHDDGMLDAMTDDG